MIHRFLILVGCICVSGTGIARADLILFGSDTGAGQLLTIDENSGATTVIGSFGSDVQIREMTFFDNVLYGVNGLTNDLVSINTISGLATPLVTLDSDVRGLAFDDSGTLFAVRDVGSNDELVTIDRATGGLTVVRATGSPGLAGLAFDNSTGFLFATDAINERLVRLDPSTGNEGDRGPLTPFQSISGIVFHNGSLLGVDDDADKLVSIDKNGFGDVLTIGDLNSPNVIGIASGVQVQSVPEPSTFTLLGLGLLIIAGRRWRRTQ